MEKITLYFSGKEKTSKEVPTDLNSLRVFISKEFSLSSQEIEGLNIYYKIGQKIIFLCFQEDYETFLKQEKMPALYLEQKKYDQIFLDDLLLKKKEFQKQKDERQALYRGQCEEYYSQVRKLNEQKGLLFQACLKDIKQIEEKMKLNDEEIIKAQKNLGLIKEEEKKVKEEEKKNDSNKKEEKEAKEEKLKTAPTQPVKKSIPCPGGQNHFPYKVMQLRAQKKEQELKAQMLATTTATTAAQANWKFDLGGGGVASGFTGVSASDGYNASKGYGFNQTKNVSNVSAGGSGAGSDAVKFNNGDSGNTFNVDLPKGLYQIKVTIGNCPRTTIKIQGMPQMINLTGKNAVETIQIPVTEGKVTMQAVAGMSGREYSISAVEINQLNTTAESRPTIWICGDSTVCNYYNSSDASQHGWGQFLGNYIDKNTYEIRNLAASGQYAKGFVDAGQFKPVEYYGKSGDIYIIAIGINDTNKKNTTEDVYKATVTDMVKRAKAKGVSVVLVKQQGRLSDLSKNPPLTTRWFGGDLDNIGKAQNVPVIDLFTAWQKFGLSVGSNGMKSYYATKSDGTQDDLHQSKKGAMKLAEIMSGLLDTKKQESGENVTNETNETNVAPESSVSFMIKNKNSGLYLEVADGKAANGANVQQGSEKTPSDFNTWTFTQATGEYYYINTNLDGGTKYFLYVDEGSKVNGGNIVIAEKNGYSDQFFKMVDNGDDTVTIYTRSSRDACVVEVGASKTDDGANVQQWESNGHDCQKWIIEKVDYPPKTSEETDKLKKAINVNFISGNNVSINGEPAIKKVNEVLTDTVEKVQEIVLTEKEKETQIEKIKQITKDTVEEINLLTKYIIDQSKELVNKLEKIKKEEEEDEKEEEIKLKSAKLFQEKKEKAKNVTHFMIQCCGCKRHNIIKGVRYKCKNCKNIDYCEKCYEEKKNAKEHLGHEFEQIFESEFIQRMKAKNTKYLQRGLVQTNERCNICGMFPIMGIRYKCVICDDFNFCENCEEDHATRHDHPLLKLTYNAMEKQFNKYYLKLNSYNNGK